MRGVYHVVCHECPFEGLYTSAKAANKEKTSHEREQSHRVSRLEIGRPKPLTNV